MTCMHDYDEQCFEDCPKCERARLKRMREDAYCSQKETEDVEEDAEL